MNDRKKREKYTVPDIYMNGADSHDVSALKCPECGSLPPTVIPKHSVQNFNSFANGDAQTE